TSYQVSNSWLHYQITQLEKWIPKSNFYESLKQLYFRSSQTQEKVQKSEADFQAIQRLSEYFQPYNKKLVKITNLDLQHWME
ncbi:MAG: hypothetical protein AAFO82_25140, partial [Bacteroidota bacterium]